jgi:hypothetical protein
MEPQCYDLRTLSFSTKHLDKSGVLATSPCRFIFRMHFNQNGAIMVELNVLADTKISRFCRPARNSSNYIN